MSRSTAAILAVAMLSFPAIASAEDGDAPQAASRADAPAPTEADLAYFRDLGRSSKYFPRFHDLTELADVESLWFLDTKMNDAEMVHLRGLSRLKTLSLDRFPISDGGLANLAGLTRLEYLSLSDIQATDAGLAHLAGLTRMETLSVDSEMITDAGLVHLAGMTRMKHLALYGSRITDAGLAHLAGLTGMERLSVGSEKVTDAGLAHLAGMTRMKVLFLNGTEIHGPGLAHLRGMVDLEVLGLSRSAVDGRDLSHLADLVRLRTLDFSNSGITDAGLAHLSGLERLESLVLFECHGVTDAGLAHLKGMRQLQYLELAGTAVRGPGLDHLRGLKSLKTLRLGGRITDASLVHVAELSSLEDLDLENAEGITEAGLDHLVKLSGLKKLTIPALAMGPRFTEQAKKWPNLKSLHVEGVWAREEQIAALRRSLPGVKVDNEMLTYKEIAPLLAQLDPEAEVLDVSTPMLMLLASIPEGYLETYFLMRSFGVGISAGAFLHYFIDPYMSPGARASARMFLDYVTEAYSLITSPGGTMTWGGLLEYAMESYL